MLMLISASANAALDLTAFEMIFLPLQAVFNDGIYFNFHFYEVGQNLGKLITATDLGLLMAGIKECEKAL